MGELQSFPGGDNINVPAGATMADVYSNSVATNLTVLGADHDDIALLRTGLAHELQRTGELAKAREQFDEVLRIATLNHGLYSPQAFEVRKNILDLMGEESSPERDRLKEDIRLSCPVFRELKLTAIWWRDWLARIDASFRKSFVAMTGETWQAISKEQLDSFEEALLEGMIGEWSMYLERYLVEVDSSPPPVMEAALTKAKIDYRFMIVPFGSGTIIKRGEVTVYEGGLGSPRDVIYA